MSLHIIGAYIVMDLNNIMLIYKICVIIWKLS